MKQFFWDNKFQEISESQVGVLVGTNVSWRFQVGEEYIYIYSICIYTNLSPPFPVVANEGLAQFIAFFSWKNMLKTHPHDLITKGQWWSR